MVKIGLLDLEKPKKHAFATQNMAPEASFLLLMALKRPNKPIPLSIIGVVVPYMHLLRIIIEKTAFMKYIGIIARLPKSR